MALFRCNKCSHIREVGNDYIGKSVKCPKCGQSTIIYDTIVFIKALIKKYIAQKTNLIELQEKIENKIDSNNKIFENDSIEVIDIYNTKALTQAHNYEPISKWFSRYQIQIQIDQDTIDTTGFFDEVALSMGNNYNILKFVSEQIKYIQNKGYSNVKLNVSKKNPQEIQQITSFCKEMYEYSFVAKYFYHKKDKIIRLTLQTAPKIKAFFNGIWMEWFILMKLLEYFRDKKIETSCMRSFNISFPNGVSNEIDIFFLTKDNIPICIECKSGEFRQDIEKCLLLRKKLNIEKDQFIICVFGLNQEQAKGMTSMYDVTFTNETELISHIAKIT